MAVLSLSTNLCRACSVEKPIGEFYTSVNRHGVRYADNTCKVCRTKKVNAVARRPERIIAFREWRRQHKARLRATPQGALYMRMSKGIGAALRGAKARARWEHLVGYTLDELKRHLERQFVKGMGWHNRDEWHIDHIIPQSSFTYSSPDDAEFKACWALANLRPMWASDNCSKNARRLFLL